MESRKTVFIESIMLFIISFGVFFEGIRLTKATSRVTQDVMGPGTYIIILGALLIVGTLVHVVSTSARVFRLHESQAGETTGAGVNPTVLLMVAVIAVYTSCIQYLGYMIATPVFFLLMFRVTGVNSWRRNLALTAILSAAYYLVFVYYCNVIFPRGIFYG